MELRNAQNMRCSITKCSRGIYPSPQNGRPPDIRTDPAPAAKRFEGATLYVTLDVNAAHDDESFGFITFVTVL
jgi:hypothetical protein